VFRRAGVHRFPEEDVYRLGGEVNSDARAIGFLASLDRPIEVSLGYPSWRCHVPILYSCGEKVGLCGAHVHGFAASACGAIQHPLDILTTPSLGLAQQDAGIVDQEGAILHRPSTQSNTFASNPRRGRGMASIGPRARRACSGVIGAGGT
jgi:hypothetical protein